MYTIFTTRARIIGILCAAALLFGLSIQPVRAQLPFAGSSGAILEFEPRYPRPGQEFTARLLDYSSGASLNTVTWFVDGVGQGGAGGKDIALTATELGTPMRIEALSHSPGGHESKIVRIFVPAMVDIVIEGDTIAPYFYEGRRVPSSGSTVRLSAVPHLFDDSGMRIATDKLIFHWTLNNSIVGEGQGIDTLSFTLPSLSDARISLFIEAANGGAEFSTALSIPLVEPSLQFYVHNPLSGLSRNAVQGKFTSADGGMLTVRAEPFFVSRSVYKSAQHGWSLDGAPVADTGNDPQVLMLQKAGAGGISNVSFSLQNLSALSQRVAGLFNVEFK